MPDDFEARLDTGGRPFPKLSTKSKSGTRTATSIIAMTVGLDNVGEEVILSSHCWVYDLTDAIVSMVSGIGFLSRR